MEKFDQKSIQRFFTEIGLGDEPMREKFKMLGKFSEDLPTESEQSFIIDTKPNSETGEELQHAQLA